jgi:hypothetical protein
MTFVERASRVMTRRSEVRESIYDLLELLDAERIGDVPSRHARHEVRGDAKGAGCVRLTREPKAKSEEVSDCVARVGPMTFELRRVTAEEDDCADLNGRAVSTGTRIECEVQPSVPSLERLRTPDVQCLGHVRTKSEHRGTRNNEGLIPDPQTAQVLAEEATAGAHEPSRKRRLSVPTWGGKKNGPATGIDRCGVEWGVATRDETQKCRNPQEPLLTLDAVSAVGSPDHRTLGIDLEPPGISRPEPVDAVAGVETGAKSLWGLDRPFSDEHARIFGNPGRFALDPKTLSHPTTEIAEGHRRLNREAEARSNDAIAPHSNCLMKA